MCGVVFFILYFFDAGDDGGCQGRDDGGGQGGDDGSGQGDDDGGGQGGDHGGGQDDDDCGGQGDVTNLCSHRTRLSHTVSSTFKYLNLNI